MFCSEEEIKLIIKKETESKLRNEEKILLLCSQNSTNNTIKNKIFLLINQNVNWSYLIELASNHNLMPILYVNLESICPEYIPKNILNQLKNNFQTNTKKNLLLFSELIKIMQLFKSENIDAIPYKGPILAYSIYSNIGYREFGDIDILIKKSDALKVKEIMIKKEYEFYTTITIEDDYYMKFITEHQFLNRNNGAMIEIKWKFEGDFFYFPADPNILLTELTTLKLNGMEFKQFSPENQLLILCIHASKHYWIRLSWICDISELIKRKEIDWDKTFKKANKLGICRILLINLFLARDLLELEIPDFIIELFNSDPSVKTISLQIKKNIFSESPKSLSLIEKLFLDLQKREYLLYGIKDCVNSLTKPGYKDYEDFSLPKSFFFIYYIIRPFLLIKRYMV